MCVLSLMWDGVIDVSPDVALKRIQLYLRDGFFFLQNLLQATEGRETRMVVHCT